MATLPEERYDLSLHRPAGWRKKAVGKAAGKPVPMRLGGADVDGPVRRGGGRLAADAVAGAFDVPEAQLGIRVKLPPLAAGQRPTDASHPRAGNRRTRVGGGGGRFGWDADAAPATTTSPGRSLPPLDGPLEYATTALRITGQNAPGYDERHERLAHLPQITTLRDYGYNPGDDSRRLSSDDPAAVAAYRLLPGEASGDGVSEFAEQRIRQILESEGVRAAAAAAETPTRPRADAGLPAADSGGVRKRSGGESGGLVVRLERVASIARSVRVRMAILRSYNSRRGALDGDAASLANYRYKRKLELTRHLPRL